MEITKHAYSEVYAILNLLSWNLINKIPENIWKNIEDKRDKENVVEIYDIKEYHASEQASKLLAVLYKNYFATDEEKNIIIAKEKILFQRKQEELQKKYNSDDMFKNKDNKLESIKVTENKTNITEYKESIFTKTKNWIKRNF